ncbi:uncharacterized protein B0I36DRAFT_245340 [Microdochium trichocladiopsis]|uniref:Uncharacterized protein n=1 Tax=Microdochium trichocladiopsis TaxID=1682393 RepID=A0A9P8Y563_9PEZI|nr:uncharacterized protein B0I36DRAFT_245340 [Microdochium trichocladiopsis]KAH7029235.1 hypothetical protein B0I36DRAFT_245340 [Microdochium trichocladiopsis]
MSSTITIPSSRSTALADTYGSSSKVISSPSSSYSSSPSSPASHGKSPSSSSSSKPKMLHQRRPSLLSSAFCKDECTVINIGDPDGPPRLISYLASSQGFTWNPEIFLPSYIDYDYTPLEHRREPVHDIVLTDEESKKLLPQ